MKQYRLLFIFLPFMLAGCETSENSAVLRPADALSIASWNVQALFDGEESGQEYADYRASTGWTNEKYLARLNTLGTAIKSMAAQAPDIIALLEVENSKVLEDLARGQLAKQGYQYTFFGVNRNMGLGLGIISRYPFEETLIHSITDNGETSPRPVLEVRVRVGGAPVVVLACHWKSKVDGEAETEHKRKASARVVLRRVRELREENIPVIVVGDLNENHDEFFRTGQSTISALMPDDSLAAEIAGAVQMDFLILSQEKPPQSSAFSETLPESVALYTPWDNELLGGSYNYQNEWESIDHLLLSSALFDNAGWDFDSCALLNAAPFIKTNGKPYSYNADTGNGLSDHLPLLLNLKLCK
jgi:endonuclease/exonuclease/phosphatase family metal-dependent hydrolase